MFYNKNNYIFTEKGEDGYMSSEKVSTKELFDMFFNSENYKARAAKVRGQIDRKEVYEFEEKLGKQLFYMTPDELFEMILSFNGNRKLKNANYGVSYQSYQHISSLYRALFDFYIDNVEVVKNPFNEKQMRGVQAAKRLSEGKEAFSLQFFESLISNLYLDFDEERAMYFECIMRLFYCGFAKAEEIALLDEEMINKKEKIIVLPGKIIQLSDRCYELLEHIHNTEKVKDWHGKYILAGWRGHYFKYIIRPKNDIKLQEKELLDISRLICRTITVNVQNKYGVDINYKLIFYLGFYEYLKKHFGDERAKELILSVRDSRDVADLMGAARNYGITSRSITELKKDLRPYIGG